ncbi:MAG TPA: alpha/beta hydrolase, partial [Rhodothermales bacterium]|nr:alpha/beta hydrolase [Rhodothermales bacterium]
RSCYTLLLIFLGLANSGCFVYNRIGVALLYEEAKLPVEQVIQDMPYRTDAEADDEKHRLDLFLPGESVGKGWPVAVFVHGGGWTNGDKDLTVAGADVYANIGRFFAAHGIGVAVINYRLLPTVDWREQVGDVAQAVAWVQEHIGAYGADSESLFLMGYSAGAQLAARVALDPGALGVYQTSADLCGVIAVSGAAYDIDDARTYELGGDKEYLRERFGEEEGWEQAVSVVPFVRGDAPPFLMLYAEGEGPFMHRQSEVLHAALEKAGAASEVVVVPGESHARIVRTLSRDDKTAGPAMLDFIRTTPCRSMLP